MPAYGKARETIKIFQKSSFFEITQRCNLLCEGCYYFEGDQHFPVTEEILDSGWADFFARERARGVTMGYFVGAEPALAQNRLLAASDQIPFGNIGTNGTIFITPEIPYKIHISVWGNDTTDQLLRGGSVFRKALKNYAGDERAIALYTFNAKNIPEAKDIAQACDDHGLKISFNHYSPTQDYLQKLSRGEANNNKFFRVSQENSNLILSEELCDSINDICDQLIDDFPNTVVYTKAFNRFITQSHNFHEIDPVTRIANNCRSRIRGNLSYFTSNLQAANIKCCTPNVDCSECRLYSSGWSGKLDPGYDDLYSLQTFREWLEMLEAISQIFLNKPRASSH